MNIYVGNLPYRISDDDLRALFQQYGEVRESHVITEQETGRSKGFGFVVMANEDEANAAIEALNGFESNGRKLTVNKAREAQNHPPRRGGFSGGNGGNGGRGGKRY